MSKIPGVKSIGPSSMRVKNRIVSCSGGLPPSLLQALYSCPRAPSRLIPSPHCTPLPPLRRDPPRPRPARRPLRAVCVGPPPPAPHRPPLQRPPLSSCFARAPPREGHRQLEVCLPLGAQGRGGGPHL